MEYTAGGFSAVWSDTVSVEDVEEFTFDTIGRFMLSRVSISPEVMKQMAPKLSSSLSMSSFSLDRCDLSNEVLESLLRAALQCVTLKRLQIEMINLLPVCAILKKISRDTPFHITSLKVSNNVPLAGLKDICDALTFNTSVKYLHLPNLEQTPANLGLLNNLLSVNSTLTDIYMDVVSETGINITQKIRANLQSNKRMAIEISASRESYSL